MQDDSFHFGWFAIERRSIFQTKIESEVFVYFSARMTAANSSAYRRQYQRLLIFDIYDAVVDGGHIKFPKSVEI
jgi:hypothetical protein